jgi:pimeloyl-ACP methyl ester carboxylesterase
LQSGSEKETAGFLDQQGVYLALFVDAIVRELQLPQKSVTIVGWSLGCAFLTYLLGAINDVDDECRRRLADHVKSIIFWGESPN